VVYFPRVRLTIILAFFMSTVNV